MELPNNFEHQSASIQGAYNICLEAERQIIGLLSVGANASQTKVREKSLVNIRILGHLLSSICPNDQARQYVARTITTYMRNAQPDDYSSVVELGQFFDQHFIRLFRKAKGPTPSSSRHLSRPSFKKMVDEVKADLVESPQSHAKAKIDLSWLRLSLWDRNANIVSNQALRRDNFRCLLTGKMDLESAISIQELATEARVSGVDLITTQCCHIFPESTNARFEDANKEEYAATVWAIVENFGYPGLWRELLGIEVHSLKNILTLDVTLHNLFDTLRLCFEPTSSLKDVPNCYKVVTFFTNADLLNLPLTVTFMATDPQLELPSARYLGIHAACCRLAHMSGAAKYLDELDHETEDYDGFVPVNSDKFAAMLAARLHDLSFEQPSTRTSVM